ALTGANSLLGIGGLEQQLGQEQLNVPYEEFQQQQAYPFQTTNWLSGITEGIGSNAGGTSTTTSPGPSTGSQILGGVAGIGGLLGATGAFGSNGWLTGNSLDTFGTDPVSGFGGTVQGIDSLSGLNDLQPIRTGGRVMPRRAVGGIVPRFASGGAPVSSSVPDVSISFIPQPMAGQGGIASSWMRQPNVTTTSSGGGSGV